MSHVTDFPGDITLARGAVMDILGIFNDGVEPLTPSEVPTVEAQGYRHEERISELVTTLNTLGGLNMLTSDQRQWLRQLLIVELAFLGATQYRLDTRPPAPITESFANAEDTVRRGGYVYLNGEPVFEPSQLPRRDGGYPFEPPAPAEA